MYIDNGNTLFRIHDGTSIPKVVGNRDYDEYLEWVAAGGVPESPASTPAAVPEVVSMRQARIALHRAGHLATVNAAVVSMPEEAQIEWEYATDVRRDNPLTEALAVILDLDATALDSLFLSAASV